MKIIQGQASITMEPATMVAEATVVANFAAQHFESAKIFRDHARALEFDPSYDPMTSHFQRLRAYVTGCIMSAAASLEALINELYIADGSLLRASFSNFDKEFWDRKNGIEGKPPLSKYQDALKRLKCDLFDVKQEPYLSARALCELRNVLMHHKPIWDAKRRRVDLEQTLSGYFRVPEGFSDFVSVKCMSTGCGTWCVETVKHFVTEFDRRTDIDADKMKLFYVLFQD